MPALLGSENGWPNVECPAVLFFDAAKWSSQRQQQHLSHIRVSASGWFTSPGISSVCGVNAGAAVNADCGVGACGFVPWAWVAVFRWVARGWLGTDGRGSGR